LLGDSVTLGTSCNLSKSVNDQPIRVTAASAVTISSSALTGGGLEVSASGPAAAITFTGNEAKGGTGTDATFSAPGGSCDLTGTRFVKMAVDVSECGSVTGP
jgi:hypothetical protein